MAPNPIQPPHPFRPVQATVSRSFFGPPPRLLQSGLLPSTPLSLALAHSTAATPPPSPCSSEDTDVLLPEASARLLPSPQMLFSPLPRGPLLLIPSHHVDGWLPATLLTTTSAESPSVYHLAYFVFPIISVWKRLYSLAQLSNICFPHEDTALGSYSCCLVCRGASWLC